MSAALNTTDEFELDLDAVRAARREAKNKPPAIKVGGQRLELPVELPIDVLAPLTEVDMDLAVLVRMALDARDSAQRQGEAGNWAVIESVVDMLVANGKLPQDLINAVKTGALRLFGEAGYNHLATCRLTLPDLGAIAKFAARQYGVGLGEASPSSDSSEGTGTTSKPTSRAGGRATTSAGSGRSRARKAS